MSHRLDFGLGVVGTVIMIRSDGLGVVIGEVLEESLRCARLSLVIYVVDVSVAIVAGV